MYDEAAKKVDSDLVGTAPSRAQLHRWASGELKRLPYTDHCRVLENMFPGWTADQLFAPCPDDVMSGRSRAPSIECESCPRDMPMADVAAVFTNRAEFTYRMPPHTIFDDAMEIKAAGLSLNLICQQYPDQGLRRLIENGTELQCLFLDPDGEAIQAREREEGYTDHQLIMLTRLNIGVLTRLRDGLPPVARQRLSIGVYDETIRFGIVLVDGRMSVVQPYLPQARGVDCPTFVLNKGKGEPGLYGAFARIYTEIWHRSRAV